MSNVDKESTMPERDPLEALRDANPVAAFAIDRARRDQMHTAIVSGPPAMHGPHDARGWQLKTVAIAAALALILIGVFALRGSGTQALLKTISIRSVQSSQFGSTPGGSGHGGPGNGGVSTITFVPGPLLSSATSSGAIYSFDASADPSIQLAIVASALGIANPQVVVGGNNGCGIGLAGKGAKLFTDCNPTLEWIYNIDLPSCQGVTTNAGGQVVPCIVAEGFNDSSATQAQLEHWSSQAAAAVTPSGITLGDPVYASGLNYVTYPCEFDGVAIVGCDVIFQYSNAGTLLYASGPLAPSTPTELGSYPLTSPRDAVSEVDGDLFIHGSSRASSAVTVTLTSSTTVYEVATLTDGTDALLPAYSYVGSNGGTYTAIAVSPSLVNGPPTPASSRGNIR
jgi:hypothetical protein